MLFQPHRYTRTQALADDFGKVLQAADLVFITDVYPASRKADQGHFRPDHRRCDESATATSPPPICRTSRTAHHVVGNALQPGDLLITLGAGNVHEAGTRIADDLKILEEMRALMPPGEIDGKLYEPMSRHTTLLVGGPAQYWIEPHSFYGFAFLVDYCRERGIPVRVVGRGSNLLVRDGGIRGAVIHPTGGVVFRSHRRWPRPDHRRCRRALEKTRQRRAAAAASAASSGWKASPATSAARCA